MKERKREEERGSEAARERCFEKSPGPAAAGARTNFGLSRHAFFHPKAGV